METKGENKMGKCGGKCGSECDSKISLDKEVDDVFNEVDKLFENHEQSQTSYGNASNNIFILVGYICLVVFVLTLTLLSVCPKKAHADTAGVGTFSEGYRMGVINKFSIKGIFTDSGEGEMLMGRDSSQTPAEKGKTQTNPWKFSVSKTMSKKVSEGSGDYVWVRYTQAQFHNPTEYNTDYLIQDIQPVTRQAPPSCEIMKPNGAKSDGFRLGRMVKVSQKGNLGKSGEIIMQVGNAGNQFQSMTINDAKMYECAVAVLKSGKPVKIYYEQFFFRNILNSDTSYSVWKIEAPKDI